MASDYGLNFGFRRSDESVANREGRFKTPLTGTFLLGTIVMIDVANPGYLKAGTSGVIGEGGTVGLLVQEEIWDRSIYGTKHLDSYGLGTALNNRPCALWSGAGVKVWFHNTVATTRIDGRVTAANLFVEQTGTLPAVLDYLKWDGVKYTNTGATAANSMLRVTWVDQSTQTYEAVLIR